MVDAVVVDLNRASPRDEALWEAKLEERAAEGHVNPGTSEEEHALARIDELRQEDTAGRIAGAHPDLGGDFHFRKGVSDREIKRRRSAARRHWKRYAKNAVA
jgi:hypothetical protein